MSALKRNSSILKGNSLNNIVSDRIIIESLSII